MVAGSVSMEMEFPVERKRIWNAIVKDSHNLFPTQAPEIISGVTLLQGDGGVGTIRKKDFTPAIKDFSYLKERVDKADEENMSYGWSNVEGGMLGTIFDSMHFRLKLSPKSDGGRGCTAYYTCNYDTLPGIGVKDAKVEEWKSRHTRLLRLIEAYLIANPTSYC